MTEKCTCDGVVKAYALLDDCGDVIRIYTDKEAADSDFELVEKAGSDWFLAEAPLYE